jgi:hypothetical protein
VTKADGEPKRAYQWYVGRYEKSQANNWRVKYGVRREEVPCDHSNGVVWTNDKVWTEASTLGASCTVMSSTHVRERCKTPNTSKRVWTNDKVGTAMYHRAVTAWVHYMYGVRPQHET